MPRNPGWSSSSFRTPSSDDASPCLTLDEGDCLTAAGCRGTYETPCPRYSDECTLDFARCEPVHGSRQPVATCEAIAEEAQCVGHDDCAAVYGENGSGAPSFAGCVAEPLAYIDDGRARW